MPRQTPTRFHNSCKAMDNGTILNTTDPFLRSNSDSFTSYGVYLNGDDSTGNGFILLATSGGELNVDEVYRNYAGLLAGADVGRFSDALLGTATWQGRFYSSAITVGADSDSRIPTRLPLTLTVDFDAGTIGTLGDVRLLNDHLVNIAGTFGFDNDDENQGILGGFITYTDPSAIVAQRITRAPIYGIIGDAGALGVFASGKYRSASGQDLADSPLIGGFEVSPNPVATANYQVFYDYFSTLPEHDERRLYDALLYDGAPNDFSTLLEGTRKGLILTGLDPTLIARGRDKSVCPADKIRDCQVIDLEVVRLAGNPRSSSGFAIMTRFSTERPTGEVYAGLLSGTDLGAVLPIRFASGSTTAVWHGSIYHSDDKVSDAAKSAGFLSLVHRPLSLTVDLAAGTLRTVDLLGNLGAFTLSSTNSVTIDGRFSFNERTAKLSYGILIGDVLYNGLLYHLAGLIGVEGAIGVFARDFDSNSGNVNGSFSHGGFQVSPPPPPAYGRANYAVFEDFYHRAKISSDIRYVAGSRTDDTAQFVRGTQIGLVNPASTGTLDSGSFAPLTVHLGGDVYSGNAFVIENFNGTHVAGLLASTDLGFAPHADLATATWEGTFYLSNNVHHVGADRSAPAPFEIKSGVVVDFAAGTLTSSQAEYRLAGAGEGGEFVSFGIFGEFGEINELPLGILGGVVKYSSAASSALLVATDLRNLPVIGVIGREGALGVFRDPSNNNLVGGFQVGDGASYRVWRSAVQVPDFAKGFRTSISPHSGANNINTTRVRLLEANSAGTGLIAECYRI